MSREEEREAVSPTEVLELAERTVREAQAALDSLRQANADGTFTWDLAEQVVDVAMEAEARAEWIAGYLLENMGMPVPKD